MAYLICCFPVREFPAFYQSHSNNFVLVVVLQGFHSETYIKIRSAMENIRKVYSAATLKNRDFAESQLECLRIGSIGRFQFVKVLRSPTCCTTGSFVFRLMHAHFPLPLPALWMAHVWASGARPFKYFLVDEQAGVETVVSTTKRRAATLTSLRLAVYGETSFPVKHTQKCWPDVEIKKEV